MPVFTKGNKHYLFVHIPKTGGTSIEKCFIDSGFRINYRDTGGKASLNGIRKCSPQHMHAELLVENFDISKFDGVFSLVRHPLSRIKSEFGMRNHNLYKGDRDHFKKWFDNVSFQYSENRFLNDNHLRPQSEFLLAPSHIYKLEDGMEKILTDLQKDFDIKLNIESVPHNLNREKQSGFSTSDVFVDEKTKERIKMMYHDDFEILNYGVDVK